jgi:hypothetical protein
MSAHNLVTLTETKPNAKGENQLIIKPQRWNGCRVAIRDCRDIWDILEYQMGNGWERVGPEEVGALTDGPIITQEAHRDDEGKLIRCGRVYWFDSYAVVDEVEHLGSGKALIFRGVA